MSSVSRVGRQIGNGLFRFAFPIYRPLYSAFKAYQDRAERRFLAHELADASVVVDAGANIGIYSRFLARCVGPRGTVHSFEPDPVNFARLQAALSSFPNVRLNQLALSDRTGVSVLYVSDRLNVDHRTYPSDGDMRRAVPIRCTALDDYFKSGERVDLFKMDIQGFELHALRGAERVLSENPSLKLLLEFWPFGLQSAGTSAQELLTFLGERDFAIFCLNENGLTECDDPINDANDSAAYLNLFARKKHSAR